MATRHKIQSFHRSLLLVIVGFSLFVVLASQGTLSAFIINDQKDKLVEETTQWGQMVGLMSIEDIKNVDYTSLRNKLSRTIALSDVNYIHVYRKVPETDDIVFFTSFNRSTNHPPIPEKIAEIDKLSTPNITSNYIEMIMPIKSRDVIVGYIYLQSGLEALNTQGKKFLFLIGFVALVILVIAIVLARHLKNKLLKATYPVLTTIQTVAQKKDFTQVCPASPITEIDSISQNINILLNRTQKHITRQVNENQKILDRNKALQDKVDNRTDALKESNQELLTTLEKLHQFQNQLVESEKMASLGDMVAGVAHEVNTPIGLGVTASTLLEDRLKEIKQAFENKTLKSSQLKKFLEDGEENISIIYRNLERAANLISSFKKVAVDQSNEDERPIIMDELFNGVLLTLAPKLKSLPYTINIDCPENLVVSTKAGPISQIIINLVMNSIIHGFDGAPEGRIDISVLHLSHQLNISYRDNGKGVDKSIRNKIFDPFTTTKRGEGGSGLGLHLVYNLITQALGGNIVLEDTEEKGVLFEMSFPIKEI